MPYSIHQYTTVYTYINMNRPCQNSLAMSQNSLIQMDWPETGKHPLQLPSNFRETLDHLFGHKHVGIYLLLLCDMRMCDCVCHVDSSCTYAVFHVFAKITRIMLWYACIFELRSQLSGSQHSACCRQRSCVKPCSVVHGVTHGHTKTLALATFHPNVS